MNLYFLENALVEATKIQLQNKNITPNEEKIREILHREYDASVEAGEESEWDMPFDDNVQFLVWRYEMEVPQEEEKKEPTFEEKFEEALGKLQVGFNFVPGLGVGYAKDQKDLEAMKAWLRLQAGPAILLSRIFED